MQTQGPKSLKRKLTTSKLIIRMRVYSFTNIVYKHQLNIIYWDRLRGEPKHSPIDKR